MNAQLEKELVRDLRKSGFYAEMMTIRACSTAQWKCRGSFTYFDKDERMTRECDFEAVNEWHERRNDGTAIRAVAHLIGQVKKSEKPWIVFIDRVEHRFADEREYLLQVSEQTYRWEIGAVLREHSPALRNGWTASGVHEAFKKPGDTSKWYSAFVSACKACESAYEATHAIEADLFARLIKPVVVVDGLLIAAELGDNDEVVLTETDHASFRFEYRSDRYDRDAYSLDLVTLIGLPRYLQRAADRMSAVFSVLQAGGAQR